MSPYIGTSMTCQCCFEDGSRNLYRDRFHNLKQIYITEFIYFDNKYLTSGGHLCIRPYATGPPQPALVEKRAGGEAEKPLPRNVEVPKAPWPCLT